ncbi:MAG: UDP-N-acetylmuramoyl-L-alanine--D-glutamate ligase [Candidatus Firestonebacteria bacterium]
MEDFKDKRIVILGLGKSGVSAAKLLKKLGAHITISDLRKENELTEYMNMLENKEDFKFDLGGHTEEILLNADKIIISPGVPSDVIPLSKLIEKNIDVISEVELAYRFLKGQVVGITGTKGKTTTVTLLSDILKEGCACRKVKTGGNIGKPLTSLVANGNNEENVIYVVELSSFQLETIKDFKPDIAVILNVSSDHMNRYKNIQEYVEAKSMIFKNQEKKDILILNANDRFTPLFSGMARSKIYLFSSTSKVEEGVYLDNDGVIKIRVGNEEVSVCNKEEVIIKGLHNLENIMVASLIGYIHDVEIKVMSDVIKKFQGVEHRQEFVAEINGVKFINNSQGTNIFAVEKSLLSYDEPIVLIAGGRNKKGNFEELRDIVKKKVKKLILIGEAKKEIKNALEGYVDIIESINLEEAVREAYKVSVPNDIILLSPGCASFDMFKNYEERGKVFKETVKKIKEESEM